MTGPGPVPRRSGRMGLNARLCGTHSLAEPAHRSIGNPTNEVDFAAAVLSQAAFLDGSGRVVGRYSCNFVRHGNARGPGVGDGALRLLLDSRSGGIIAPRLVGPMASLDEPRNH